MHGFMETVLTSKISSSWAGISLLQFLSTRFKYHSEREWIALIYSGKVLINENRARPESMLARGDVVSYHVVLREPPANTNIQIVYEDEYLLAASKPPNLPSHADGNFITHTFIYILNEMMRAKGNCIPYKLVNRLDRETSGLILASNNPAAHKNLSRQFETGQVRKEYIAVARGVVHEDSFSVEGTIVPDSESRISIRRKVGITGGCGKHPVVTSFEVIERLRGYTLIRCIPGSGKTAQIRVHLAYAGFPLAGDKLYGRSDEEFLEYVARVRAGNYESPEWLDAPRHMLHAHRLVVLHPGKHVEMEFADPLPDDMASFIQAQQIKK